MVIFYKKWKKYNEIQLTKNKMDFNNQKMTNHPPSPIGEPEDEWYFIYCDQSFSAENNRKHNYQWSNCDQCPRKMHLK